MQARRWRWLWIWVSVLVAGCGQGLSSDATPPPTRGSPFPLFDYTLLPPSLTPSVWPLYTATPLLTADSASTGVSQAEVYLFVSGPTCYETPVGSLVCLGRVQNPLEVPVERVIVVVQLLALDGYPLATEHAATARMLLPASSFAPYRVLFEQIPDQYAGAYAFAKSAQLAEYPGRYASLSLHQTHGGFVNGQYEVSLVLHNDSPAAAEQVSVTVTLLDAAGRVTGFRQVALEDDRRLEPGESLSLVIKVVPQGSNTVTFETFASGLLSPN